MIFFCCRRNNSQRIPVISNNTADILSFIAISPYCRINHLTIGQLIQIISYYTSNI